MEVEIINTVIINMATQKKLIDYRRSYKDQSNFEIFYPISNKITELQLIPNVPLNQFVRTGEVLGYIQEGEGIKNLIEAPLSGTITQIISPQVSNFKGKSVHIFTIKACEHYPSDKNQSRQEKQVMVNKSILQTADTCVYCGQTLWFYYEKKQNQITYRELKRTFEKFNVNKFDWRVQVGEQYTRDTQIGYTNDEYYYLVEGGKITYLYPFDTKDQPQLDQVVLKFKNVVCKHQKMASGFCCFCLVDVNTLKNVSFLRYLFQHELQNFDKTIFSAGNTLDSQIQEFKNKILQQKKCVLVLDLDNTILHSSSLRKLDNELLSRLPSIQDCYIIPPQKNTESNVEKTAVKLRPNIQYFLSKIIDLFEIFIYTKGTRDYAQLICQIVRENYKDILSGTNNFLPYRVLSRNEDSSLQKKNLDKIIPKNREFLLILDDRRDVWNHSPLCVYTRPYVYFYNAHTTPDGHIKLEPVEWEKGGGSIEHKLNQFEQKCIAQIKQAEAHADKALADKMKDELQKQIKQTEQKQREQYFHPVVAVSEVSSQTNSQQNLSQTSQKQTETIAHQRKRVLFRQDIISRTNPHPDQYLVTTLFALKQSHTIYFQKLALPDDEQKRQGKYTDLGYCFNEYKKSLLNHLTVGFICINRDIKKLGSYRRAQKMGLKIAENLSQPIDILIRTNQLAAGYSESSADLINKFYTEAVRKMKSISEIKKIPIVSQTWIDVCYEYNCCVHHKYFQPEDPYAMVVFSNQSPECRRAINQSTGVVADKIRQILKQSTDNTEFDVLNPNKDSKQE